MPVRRCKIICVERGGICGWRRISKGFAAGVAIYTPVRRRTGVLIKSGHAIFFSRLLRAVLLIPRREAAAPWFPFDSLRASLTRNASASLRVGNLADS